MSFCLLSLSVFLIALRLGRREKKTNLGNNDFELATLPELPLHLSVINCNNPIYEINHHGNEIEAIQEIPKFDRKDIEFIKLLGSGAFGDVFEGEIKPTKRKIAIKTLKNEKTQSEFLKEAIIMFKFNHEHVLKLIGIVLDEEKPPNLILELMEGGDLLKYLRLNRPSGRNDNCNLNLGDLVKICQDVAKGCNYLENIKHIHRDIAARNCLVSNHNSRCRKVNYLKIIKKITEK